MRVLGIDPGLAGTGYGVIETEGRGLSVRETGVIETGPKLALDVRLHLIYQALDRLLAAHAPRVLVLEDLYSEYRFPQAALLMAHARGVVCLAARQHAVTLLALAPAEVKQAIAANGAASKAQVQHGVRRLLGLADLPRPAHVADALALALTGLWRIGHRMG
jgi:crossover junction endodeoxyribonuclease RuvC